MILHSKFGALAHFQHHRTKNDRKNITNQDKITKNKILLSCWCVSFLYIFSWTNYILILSKDSGRYVNYSDCRSDLWVRTALLSKQNHDYRDSLDCLQHYTQTHMYIRTRLNCIKIFGC